MSFFRFSSIPLLLLVGGLAPIYWAYPSELPFARTLGICLGWGGCSLLLLSLVLILRETRLANAFGGLERMYRWHHRVGMAGYVLLLAHPLFLATDALPENWVLAWQVLSSFDQGGAVLSGWLSLLGLMLGLAATFVWRMPYRFWRSLHTCLGIGVLLGLLHLLLLGIDEPVLPIAGLACVLLGWRIVSEDRGLLAHPYVVQEVRLVTQDMVELLLKPIARPVTVKPGQFVLLAFSKSPNFSGCGEFHPFTVSGIGENGEIKIGIKALGECTRHIQHIVPGSLARLDGGFGSFLADQVSTAQLWVAGGIGITPFLALLREAPPHFPTKLIYLYRNEADAAFLPELNEFAATYPGFSLFALATGDAVPDLDALLSNVGDLIAQECYLCGPPGMVEGVRTALRRKGLKAHNIHFENFDFR